MIDMQLPFCTFNNTPPCSRELTSGIQKSGHTLRQWTMQLSFNGAPFRSSGNLLGLLPGVQGFFLQHCLLKLTSSAPSKARCPCSQMLTVLTVRLTRLSTCGWACVLLTGASACSSVSRVFKLFLKQNVGVIIRLAMQLVSF